MDDSAASPLSSARQTTMASWSTFVVLVLLAQLMMLEATKVKPCRDKGRQGKMINVDIGSCQVPPCILKKRTNATIDIKFIPDNDVHNLRNRVSANVGGVRLPFVGVDGTASCSQVFLPDGVTRAGCPLRAGAEYLYRNSFHVQPYYPEVNPIVHWSLQDASKNVDVVCFEVSSRIQNS